MARRRDEEEEEEEEDYEDVMDEEEYDGGGKAGRKHTRSDFIDDAAKEDDDELEKFRQPGESRDDGDMASLSTLLANRKKCHFMKGDRVIVFKGDLKNQKGWVQKVEGNTVHIRPKQKDLPAETITVDNKEVCKYFEPGNHVQVVFGASEGVTGMVVSVDGHMVKLVSDTTKELIRVFADCVVESYEITSGATRIRDYELHGLVLLDNGSFGVIIRVDSEAFQVLKGVHEKAEVALVRQREIKGRVNKKGTAHDCCHNAFSVKDVVKVLEGPYKGKQGPVEHIYRGFVFINDCHHLEHAGFICAKVQSCILVGRSRANGDRKADPFSSRFGNLKTPPRVPQSPMRSYRGSPPRNWGEGEGPWFLPDIAVNVPRNKEANSIVGVIREVLAIVYERFFSCPGWFL